MNSDRIVVDTSRGGSIFLTKQDDGTVWLEIIADATNIGISLNLNEQAIEELKEALEGVS